MIWNDIETIYYGHITLYHLNQNIHMHCLYMIFVHRGILQFIHAGSRLKAAAAQLDSRFHRKKTIDIFYGWCLHMHLHWFIHMCVSLNCGTPKTGPHSWSFLLGKPMVAGLYPLRSGKLDPDEDVQVQVTFQAWIKGGINRCCLKKRDQQSSFNMYIYNVMYMGIFIPNSYRNFWQPSYIYIYTRC